MARNLLTDRAIRNAKPRAENYRLCDGDGLFVLIATTGGKAFEYRYKINDKGNTYTLKGVTSLAEARRDMEPLRRMVAAGEHPRDVMRRKRAAELATDAQTFAVIAAAWIRSEARRKQWDANYVDEVKQSLRNHLSALDPLPISSVVARVTTPLLHAVEVSAPMMEEKVARRLNAIMDFAVELGALELNPLPRRRRGKVARKHFPAITSLPELGEILRDARAADPCKGIQRAHTLLAFAAERPSETVGAPWGEMDLQSAVWSIRRDRMKRKDVERGPHQIPIPPALAHCHAPICCRRWHRPSMPLAAIGCSAWPS